MIFKEIVAAKKDMANINRTGSNNNNSSNNNRVRTASMPPGEWVPGFCVAWSPDSDEKAILEYNNRVLTEYYRNKGSKRVTDYNYNYKFLL